MTGGCKEAFKSHTLKSNSASVKFLCRAGDKYWAVVRMMLWKETHTHSRYCSKCAIWSILSQCCMHPCCQIFVNSSSASYLLVSSLMMFQSRGKILSFIRFLNTHRIFNKNSCREGKQKRVREWLSERGDLIQSSSVPSAPLYSGSFPSGVESGCRSSVWGGTGGRTRTLPANERSGDRLVSQPLCSKESANNSLLLYSYILLIISKSCFS